MDPLQILYKIGELKKMYSAETDPETGGYGAHLVHWSGTAKPINIDAGALEALIHYYSSILKKEETK